MSARHVLERFSRGIVLRRRLSARFGHATLFVSPEAGLKFWRRDLEKTDPWLLTVASELVKPKQVVWDIGANVGLFTFAAAYLAGADGKIVSFEPDVWLVHLLRRSAQIRESRRADVEVVAVAITDCIGVVKFNVANRARAANFVDGTGTDQAGGIREQQTVLAVTLDWLLDRFPVPHIVKIDVEGAEVLVLRGAQRLLSSVRPVIVCEVSPHNAAAVGHVFRSNGYDCFDGERDLGRHHALSEPVWNTLAVPSEL